MTISHSASPPSVDGARPAPAPAAPAPPAPPARPYRLRWIVLAVVLAADAMDLLDSTIVTVAAPSVRRDLGGGVATLQWLSAAYALTFAVFLITGARLGDIFGRRRLFLIGSAGFTAFSAACALAPSPTLLIVFRALQGASGALLIPQGFGLLKEVFREEEMPIVFGAFGPVMGLAAIAGPLLAGVLIGANVVGTGWRMVFLINLPIGVVALIAAARVLPRTVHVPEATLDVIGMILVGASSVALIYPLIQGREAGWPLWTFAMLAGGLALAAIFVRHELRRPRRAALIEVTLLRNAAYTNGIVVALGFFATFGGLVLVLSVFCQLGERFSPTHTALTLVPMTVGMMVAMALSFALVRRLGRALLQIGIAVAAGGLALLAVIVSGRATASTWALVPGELLVGLGAGFVFGQLFDIILAGVAMEEVGSASGVLNAVQQLAGALGVAVLGTVFFSDLGTRIPTHALGATLWVCLVPVIVTFALAFRLPRHPREPAARRLD